jgi:hypothetical protein
MKKTKPAKAVRSTKKPPERAKNGKEAKAKGNGKEVEEVAGAVPAGSLDVNAGSQVPHPALNPPEKTKELNVSDEALFKALVDEPKKPKQAKRMVTPAALSSAPPSQGFVPSRAQMESMSLNWDAAIQSVVNMMANLGLPFDKESLQTLRLRVSKWKVPAFFTKPIIAAIDVLIGDEDMLKNLSAPFKTDE